MNDMPLSFDEQMIMSHWHLQPDNVHGVANTTTEYYKRYLYLLISSAFKFNIPWALNWFRFFLFRGGSIAAIYTKEYGWIAQPYSVLELDMEYNPAVIQVYNQFLPEAKKGLIGVNAEIIKLLDDYWGLDDLVTRTAEMLAQFDKTINVNLMNASVTKMFEAENKKEADTIKEAYGRATTGDPFVVINKDVMGGKTIGNLLGNATNEYIVDKLLSDRRTCLNNFLTTIGIRNANYDKKERLNSQEVTENNDETSAIVGLMLESIRKGFDKVNAMSGLDLSVELNFDYSEGGSNNGQINA